MQVFCFFRAGSRRGFSFGLSTASVLVAALLVCFSPHAECWAAAPAAVGPAVKSEAAVAAPANGGTASSGTVAAPPVEKKTPATKVVTDKKRTAAPKSTAKKPATAKKTAGTPKSAGQKKVTPAAPGSASGSAPSAAKTTAKAVDPAKTAPSAKTPAAVKTPVAGAKASPAATTAGTAPPAAPPKFPASKVVPLATPQSAALPVAETWMPLVVRLNKDGIPMEYLRGMFGRIGDVYSHEPMGTKVTELFTNKYVQKPPRTAPVQKSTTPPVYKSMVTPESVAKCAVYLEMHAAAFAAMEARYGVPKEVIAGLLMVETRLGTFLGHNSSFWSLACMASADKPERVEATVKSLPLPMTPDREQWLQQILRERSSWAYKELFALIKHGMDNGLDPLAMPGSVYGAIGICQFMPSNLPKFAVDGNNDGRIDLFDPADAIASVGNYLKEHGWTGKDRQEKDRPGHHATLKRYNKSNIYANTILALADAMAAPPEALTADAGTKPAAGKGDSAATTVKAKTAPKADAGTPKKASVKKAPAKPGAKKAAPKATQPSPAKKGGNKASGSSAGAGKPKADPGRTAPAAQPAGAGAGDVPAKPAAASAAGPA